jgi:hypothetical protein
MRDLFSDKSVLSHLLDSQTPGGQGSEQLGFRFGQVEPSKPIRPFEDHQLTIVDRRDVRPPASGATGWCHTEQHHEQRRGPRARLLDRGYKRRIIPRADDSRST